MHESFIELALLLQDGSQIGMRGGKLGEDIQGLQIEARRFFDETLLPFDVGQIVERVGMGRTQAQGRRVTIFRILWPQQTPPPQPKKATIE
jgi:hypothetical protein